MFEEFDLVELNSEEYLDVLNGAEMMAWACFGLAGCCIKA